MRCAICMMIVSVRSTSLDPRLGLLSMRPVGEGARASLEGGFPLHQNDRSSRPQLVATHGLYSQHECDLAVPLRAGSKTRSWKNDASLNLARPKNRRCYPNGGHHKNQQ
jgi:hypothetical protein